MSDTVGYDRPRKRRKRRPTDPPGGSSTPPESPDRSSSSTLPPGPTAWWKWQCQLCRENAFVARAKPAVDGSGREHLYVWEYQADPQKGILEAVRWGEVETGHPPPCPWCGKPGIVSPVGPAEFPDDLQVAYDALKRLLKARGKGPKPQTNPWPNEPGDDGDLPHPWVPKGGWVEGGAEDDTP